MGQNKGYFIPTTQSWDVTELMETDVNSQKFKELIIRLYQQINLVAQQVNNKATGFYNKQEFATGETFYSSPSASSTSGIYPSPRPIFRKVIDFGAMPAPGTSPKSVAHGLTLNTNTSLVKLWGAATDPSGVTMFSFPNSTATLSLTSTNIVVSTTVDYSMYTRTFIVIEFMKN